MILKVLEIENFRLFPYLNIEFSDGINIISGLNGQGKTSILESIYYLALTKSFRTSNDNYVISLKKDHFNINGDFLSGESDKKAIRVFYSNSERKHLFINKKEVLKFSEYIGMVPCVTLTLDHLKLTLGGPVERRRFLDILISQISPVYLEDLKIYRRTLLQKNALLANENRREIKNQIHIWNQKLIEHGSRIISQRLDFIDFLNQHVSEYYRRISSLPDNIGVEYKSSLGQNDFFRDRKKISEKFLKKLNLVFDFEIERKKSVIGPHRDDIQFFKEDKIFRDYCSQGENKTLVIALKFLEWEYISKERQIKPILLLDDIFGELDEIRMQGLLDFLEVIGQAYITTTMQNKFKSHRNSRKYILKEKKLYDAN
jgi:DNA replication and repair protein RecF